MKIEKTQRRKFDGIVIYTSGGICGKKGIEEPSSNKAYNQDKWSFFAKLTFSNSSWRLLVQRGFSRLEVSVSWLLS